MPRLSILSVNFPGEEPLMKSDLPALLLLPVMFLDLSVLLLPLPPMSYAFGVQFGKNLSWFETSNIFSYQPLKNFTI